MRRLLLPLMVAAVLAAPALAQTRCATRETFSPSLDARALKGARFEIVTTRTLRPGAAEQSRESAVETANLPGGIKLIVGLRGCEAHVNVYSFTLPRDAHADSDAPYWLGRAADLLMLIHPANLDRKMKLDVLAAELRQHAGAGARFSDGEFAGKTDDLSYTLGLIRESDGAVSLDVTVTAAS